MEDEPDLPRLARISETDTLPANPTRKRVRHGSFAALSSDPAIFSSDDDPSADNYSRQRNKKKFRGPWYRQVLASETNSPHELDGSEPVKKTDRKFERKYDSGVFLGSDGTDLDEVIEAIESKQASSLPLRQVRTQPRIQPPEKSEEEAWVEAQIQRCLEDGNETVDLSYRGISKLSNAALRPLATFTMIPPVSQDVFYRLEPDLKIWLSSNSLTSLPEELFLLERLTALSLRGNPLRELPPAIGKMQNLRELNISLTNLHYLPFEILNLFSETGNLKSFSIHPNPFLQPQFPRVPTSKGNDGEDDISLERLPPPFGRNRRGAVCYVTPEARRSWSPHWQVLYQARTDVRYYDKYGTLVKGPSFEKQAANKSLDYPFLVEAADDGVSPEHPSVPAASTSRVPSLVELALKTCLLQNQQQSYISMLIQDQSPEHLHRIFEQATTKKESGIEKCTICKRDFILKRTEWIEWWEIALVSEKGVRDMASAASPLGRMENERDLFESKVPLIRRGCSWLCVPSVVSELGDQQEKA